MLNIINNLRPFFEDCYREINVREYAKSSGCSPPTASKRLKNYAGEKLLLQRAEYNRLLFSANRTSADFRDLARCYWRHRLSPLIQNMERALTTPAAMLFGSLAKGEARRDSDVDIAIFAPAKKPLETAALQRQFGREITIHWFNAPAGIPNEHLRNNILNGYVLTGTVRWD